MTIYKTTSAELVNNVLGMSEIGMLAWFRECLNVATEKNKPAIADFAREIAHLYCDVKNGKQVKVVQL